MTDDAIGSGLSKRTSEFVIHLLLYAITMFFVFIVLFALILRLDFITWIVGVAWGVGLAFHGLSLFVPDKRGK